MSKSIAQAFAWLSGELYARYHHGSLDSNIEGSIPGDLIAFQYVPLPKGSTAYQHQHMENEFSST